MLLSLLLMAWLCPSTVLASADWPDNVSIESDAGIIMDANSGAVIYGKNIHATCAYGHTQTDFTPRTPRPVSPRS